MAQQLSDGGATHHPPVVHDSDDEGYADFLACLHEPAPVPPLTLTTKATAPRKHQGAATAERESGLPPPHSTPTTMCRPPPSSSQPPSASAPGPTRTLGDKVDEAIAGFFYKIGHACSSRPKTTIAVALAASALCAGGISQLTTENRPEKLWVPQDTEAEAEQMRYLSYFPPSSRFESVIVTAAEAGESVLTKENLVAAMEMHASVKMGGATLETPAPRGRRQGECPARISHSRGQRSA